MGLAIGLFVIFIASGSVVLYVVNKLWTNIDSRALMMQKREDDALALAESNRPR